MSKASHARHFSKRQSPAPGCTSGAFFKSPKLGDVVDTSEPIQIEWDTSLECFSTQGVDIYLYAPYAAKSVIHAWGGVDYNAGSFQTPLIGSWWNSSSTPIQLQLGFVQSGTPAFMSPVPTGPIFQATFNATDFGIKNPTGTDIQSGAAGDGDGIFQTIGNAYKNSGLPKGSIAAAVIVPLIAVGIAIGIFVRFQRTKEAEKRRRWSQAVDKRMSAISTEWKGLPPNAQSEAIRQSIAIMRDSRASVARMSQLYDARPISAFPSDGGQAGVGVGGRKGPGVGLRNPGAGPAQLAQRKSAISFAADTMFSRPSTDTTAPSFSMPRPSGDTQRGPMGRAFHAASSVDDPAGLMSPTQVGGPTMLGEREIHRQLDLSTDAGVAPALTMMRHDDANFLMLDHSPMSHSLLPPPSAAHLSPSNAMPFNANTPPNPAYGSAAQARGTNPFEGFTRGPSNMLSPDAMLRAYASRDGTSGTPMIVAHPASPPPQHMYPALDAPAQPAPIVRGDRAPGQQPAMGRTLYVPGQGNVQRLSEESRYSVADDDYDEAYGGYGRAA